MTLTRIAVNSRVWLFCERRLDLSLRRLRDEFVLLAEVHQQGGAQPANLPRATWATTMRYAIVLKRDCAGCPLLHLDDTRLNQLFGFGNAYRRASAPLRSRTV